MMILSKKDLQFYLSEDRKYNSIPPKSIKYTIKSIFFPNLIWKYIVTLRKCEYANNTHSVMYYWYRIRLNKLGLKLGFTIPINCFGPGLSIAHYGTIIVNGNARIGKCCRLHAGVNIGASGGSKLAPQIGDNVYIGPGSIIFGNISIADNINIGANATVNKTFDKENVVIAGTPAKVVKENVMNWCSFNNIQ